MCSKVYVIDQHDLSGDRKVHFCDDKMNCTVLKYPECLFTGMAMD